MFICIIYPAFHGTLLHMFFMTTTVYDLHVVKCLVSILDPV